MSLADLVFDPTVRSDYDSLSDYLQENDADFTQTDIDDLANELETAFFEQIQYLCYLQFYLMQKSDEWGEGGQQQVKVSFCRVLLHVPPDHTLTQDHVDRFMAKIEENIAAYGFDDLSLEAAKEKYDGYRFTIFEQTFSVDDCVKINEIFLFLGSGWFFQGGVLWT